MNDTVPLTMHAGHAFQRDLVAAAKAGKSNIAKLLLGDVDDSMLVVDPAKLNEILVKIKAENGMVEEALGILPGSSRSNLADCLHLK